MRVIDEATKYKCSKIKLNLGQPDFTVDGSGVMDGVDDVACIQVSRSARSFGKRTISSNT